jgi:uncharacterized OsmC-like protein
MTDAIRNAVTGAKAYLTVNPGEARYRDSQARATLGRGLQVSVDGPTGEALTTDMPKGIGGGASAASPGWYFRAAAASCVASLIAIRAAEEGIALPPGAVEVVVDSESDDRGILGLDPAIPAGALSLKVAVSINAPGVSSEAAEALINWAVEHCPVTDSVRRAVTVEVVIT